MNLRKILKSFEVFEANSNCPSFLSNSDDEGEAADDTMETSDNEEPRRIQPATAGNDNDEYNFNNYDSELNVQFANLGDVAVIDSGEQLQDDEDSEAEDDIIKSSDNLVIVGHVDEDAASLEVFGLFLSIIF